MINETDFIKDQLESAKGKLGRALMNFNNAEKDFIDIAIAELNVAQQEYDALNQKYRKVAKIA